ncbi:hypothetical protein [Gordonia neofelifaecis]|uniref:Uncharacterized protein n=1 Tax=Gordonia neofelifaecis NRRL B-59395 TaxID=644548 RepID=F1YPM8_9ACTN|nr:hypothetical protein [Gordonia neofelifaecis]EGD53373.1 hypothetical protein SCNU_19425 [Gordonia neofelifaecis NRRL B-59395]
MRALTADDLLNTPRGRRLLVAYAKAVGSVDLSQAFDLAANAFEDHASFGTWHIAGGVMTRFAEPPTGSPDDAAVELAALRFGEVDADVLHAALQMSVDFAWYWQAPDGLVRLAALPQIVELLRPLAEAVAASPHCEWWSSACAVDDQHLIAYAEPTIEAAPIGQSLRVGRAVAMADEAEGRRENRAASDVSGFWWSTPWAGHTTARRQNGRPTGITLMEDCGGWEKVWIRRCPVPAEARILEICEPADWAGLCRDHPFEITHTVGPDWRRVTGSDGPWLMPDWVSVAENYDAVHVTIAGYLTTATQAIDVDDRHQTMMAGWMPDGTVWLNDVLATTAAEWEIWKTSDGTGWSS